MSENTLKKLNAEAERLDDELKMLKDASNTIDACTQLIRYMEETEEPFSSGYSLPNPWHSAPNPGPCCTIM